MRRLIEKASVVFKGIDCGDRFEVLKTRDGQLTLGGKYSRDLVEFYAKTNDDVVVLEFGVEFPAEEEPLRVGDYAKTLTVSKLGNVEKGKLVKIIGYGKISTDHFNCELFDGNCSGLFLPNQLSRATGEEVAEVKRKLAEEDARRKEEAEVKRWAAIGRKPGEFRKGDAVQYKKAFTTVINAFADRVVLNHSNNVSKNIAVSPESLTLVFPVESRFE